MKNRALVSIIFYLFFSSFYSLDCGHEFELGTLLCRAVKQWRILRIEGEWGKVERIREKEERWEAREGEKIMAREGEVGKE